MTPIVVVNENGAHIITGPGNMCECGVTENGQARSCLMIIQDLVSRGLHEYASGKVPKQNIMSKQVRCKALCTEVAKRTDTSTGEVLQETVSFIGVYSTDPNSENKWFAKWTPGLTIHKSIDNPNAFGTFKVGTKYYVDFSEAPDDVTVNPETGASIELESAVPSPSDQASPLQAS